MPGHFAGRFRLWIVLAVIVAPNLISAERIPYALQGKWAFTMSDVVLHRLVVMHRQNPEKGMSASETRRMRREYARYREIRTISDTTIRRDCTDGGISWREEWFVEPTKVAKESFDARIVKVAFTQLSDADSADRLEAARKLEGRTIRCRMDETRCLEIAVPDSDIKLPGFFARKSWPADAGERLDLRVDLSFRVLEVNCELAALDVMHAGSTGSRGERLEGTTRVLSPGQTVEDGGVLDSAVLSDVALSAISGRTAEARKRLSANELALLMGKTSDSHHRIAALAKHCLTTVKATPTLAPNGYTAAISLDWAATIPDIRGASKGTSSVASVSEYAVRTNLVLWDKQSAIIQLQQRGAGRTRYLQVSMVAHAQAPRSANSSVGRPTQVATKVQLLKVRKGASEILDTIAGQKLPARWDDVEPPFVERQCQAANAAFRLPGDNVSFGPALHTVSLWGSSTVASRRVRAKQAGNKAEVRLVATGFATYFGIGMEIHYTLGDKTVKKQFGMRSGEVVMVPVGAGEGAWHHFLFVSALAIGPAGLGIRPPRVAVPNPRIQAKEP